MRKSRPAPHHHGSAMAAGAISGVLPTRPLPFAVGRSASPTINRVRAVPQQFDDIIDGSLRPDSLVTIAPGKMVVVGDSIDTPEYRWDDVKGVNVCGKVVAMLVGDLPVPNLRDGTQLDVARFRGMAMTHYGGASRPTRAFTPAALGGTAPFTVRARVRQVQSRNVVARHNGAVASLKRKYVVLSAQWDAYRIGRPINGDTSCNGGAAKVCRRWRSIFDSSGFRVGDSSACRDSRSHPPP